MLAVILVALAAVLVIVLIVALVLVVILVLAIVLVVILVSVLIFHGIILRFSSFAAFRYPSIPRFSAFILRFEQQTGNKSCGNGSGDSTGTRFQAAGKNSHKTLAVNRFLYTLGKIAAKTGKGHTGACTCKIDQRLVHADSTQKYTDHHVAYKNSGRCQLGFIDQDLTDQAERTAY